MKKIHLLVSSAAFILSIALLVRSAEGNPIGQQPAFQVSRLFAEYDIDGNDRIDETELYLALSFFRERRQAHLEERVKDNDPLAAWSLEQLERISHDPLVGTPETAAAFFVVNFDDDEDWALDRSEAEMVFASLERWRGENRRELVLRSASME